MAKGKRETAYYIVIAGKTRKVPLEVLTIQTASEFKKWKQKVHLSLDVDLSKNGQWLGKLKNGQSCFITKGKPVIPLDGITI